MPHSGHTFNPVGRHQYENLSCIYIYSSLLSSFWLWGYLLSCSYSGSQFAYSDLEDDKWRSHRMSIQSDLWLGSVNGGDLFYWCLWGYYEYQAISAETAG